MRLQVFLFLSSLAYKLVSLLVFDKNMGLGLNFTYEFEVCYTLSII